MAPFTKSFVNDSNQLVTDSLKGLIYLNPELSLDTTNSIVSLKQVSSDTVHVICGGGSGHEPSHASYVGRGMLSAAVCGNLFASPNSRQVTEALHGLKAGKGVLIVVKNYTGDVLNFGIAKERWLAQHGEEDVKMVIVGDDVSVGKEQGKITGRRGLASTVLVYKIAGAFASQGASLFKVHAVAQYIADRSATIGVGLEHCHLPGSQSDIALNSLGPEEVEVGMGIHNEPGYRRQKMTDLDNLMSEILQVLTSTTDPDRSFVPFNTSGDSSKESRAGTKDQVVLLVNNLGSLSQLEMGAIVKSAATWLAKKGIEVARAISGTLMTSLNMPGFSISLVLLPNDTVTIETVKDGPFTFNSDLLLDLLDAPTSCLGWVNCYRGKPDADALLEPVVRAGKALQQESQLGTEENGKAASVEEPQLFVTAVQAACEALIVAEPEITKYDTIAGDGDCGQTLKAGATGVLELVRASKISGSNVVRDLLQISEVVNEKMGGTSGGLYSIFFNALAIGIRNSVECAGDKLIVNANSWAQGLDHALTTLCKYTRARAPSRTLIDPLSAFILAFTLTPSELGNAVETAKESAEATMYLDAKAGRAAYVDRAKVKESEVPDAGAWGVWKILEAIEKCVDAV